MSDSPDQLRILMDAIRPRLVDYLFGLGIEVAEEQKVKCISKYHAEKTASMHILPGSDNQVLKCFGCGRAFDIFDAAHHLEDRPLDGAEFISENVCYLADKLGVERNELKYSEDQVEDLWVRRMYRDAALVFNEMATPEAAIKRGWSDELAKELEVGSIPSSSDYYQALIDKGWGPDSLVRHGIKHSKEAEVPRLFGPDRLTFLLRDERGQPVGFGARLLGIDPKPKYLNTRGLREGKVGCRIYNKDRLLYGIDKAKATKADRVDVVEGYADRVSLAAHGVHNVVGACGTAFSESHLQLLIDCGFTHINFIFDNDETGLLKMIGDPNAKTEARKKGYLHIADGVSGVKVTVGLFQDTDINDPDEYLKKHTIEEFNECIKIYDVFDWELEKATKIPGFNPHRVVEELIGYLVYETVLTSRIQKIKALALATGIPKEDLQSEYDRRFDQETARQLERLSMNLKSPLVGMSEKLHAITRFQSSYEARTLGSGPDTTQIETTRDFDRFMTIISGTDNECRGFDCGFPGLYAATNGIPKTGGVIAFPGNANAGKSAMALNIIVNMLLVEANVNLTVCLWCLDDSRFVNYAKILAILSNNQINHCMSPGEFIDPFPDRKERYYAAVALMKRWLSDGRLSVKGEETGSGVRVAERWVKQIQDDTGHHVVLVADSFNNIQWKTDLDELATQLKISSWFRTQTIASDFTAIMTMELNKMGVYEKKPRLKHIRGAAKMQYDLKFVGMFFNELHEQREKAMLIWKDEQGQINPFIEIVIEKNKLSRFKEELYYKFDPGTARLEEIRKPDALRIAAAVKEAGGINLSQSSSIDFSGNEPYDKTKYEVEL